jgi:hypothetical protein
MGEGGGTLTPALSHGMGEGEEPASMTILWLLPTVRNVRTGWDFVLVGTLVARVAATG